MRLTVVIVTYKRTAICLDTIKLMLPLLTAEDELIVVEQVNDELRQGYFPEPDKSVSFICLPQASMVSARNAAIRAARGKIILFVDDDVVPGRELLDAHAAAYIDQTVGGVAGRILGPSDSESPSRQIVSGPGWLETDFAMQTRMWVEGARGCNMSFRRTLLVTIGGFDEGFKPPFFFREDSDVSFRIRAAGYGMLFEPAAALRHLEAKNGGTRIAPIGRRLSIRSEIAMYRQHFCHYRDNLYFALKHFHGTELNRYLAITYRTYVGFSRWPWRLIAKNFCFVAAILSADRTRRRSKAPFLEDSANLKPQLLPTDRPS